MSGSLRRKLATPLLFCLFASVVIGGMTWATVATYKLAKDEHLSKVRLAVWRMEKYLGGILAVESSRPYTDYVSVHRRRTLAVIASDGRNVNINAALAVLPSPLREFGPPHDWIELYFQTDESGRFSSPQLFRGQMDWAADPELIRSGSPRRALDSFQWLTNTLTSKDLAEKVATDIAHKITDEALAGKAHVHSLTSEELSDLLADFRPSAATEYQLRIFSKIASQLEPSGRVECEAVDILNANIQNIAGQGEPLIDTSSPETRIDKSSWTTFWRESDECQCMKMAFVRVITQKDVDQNAGEETERIFYQGFIVNWNQLKPKMLALVADLFPNADLLPVTDNKLPSLEASEFVMSVPVRLSTPEMAGGVSAAAWQSVGGVLVVSWIATLCVLALSGWGVWSLVALTQRRMRFAYAVTHELRTPLTTFRLYSDMLAGGLVPEESKQDYLDTLNQESLRLSKLVEGVLEYARIENQKVQLTPVEITGAALLAGIKQELDARCDATGIESECVNQIAEHDQALIDVDVVNQIAGVLINNACRHARESDSPFVHVELSADGAKLSLEVMDSGPGVDRKDARTIFKPFRRGRGADAAARGGIGLGLALARSWAKLLGGSLELVNRSHPQLGGAHFRLKIPARTPATAKRPADDYPGSDAIPA